MKMRFFAVGLTIALLLVPTGFSRGERSWLSAISAKFSPQPFEPYSVRAGLPNLRRKLEAGEPVTVGFLGGSITQNAEKGGFIETIKTWIESKYPGARVKTINAGIAATDSKWGAARVGHDLLGENPDAVFVEFAVNDIGRDGTADMERIVRRVRKADPGTDIAFLYTASEPAFRKKLSQGKTPRSVGFHEAVAEHYDLSSLTFGSDLYTQVVLDSRPWSDFFFDDCHPKPEGYASYSRDVTSFMEAVFLAPPKASAALPPPLVAGADATTPGVFAQPFKRPEAMVDRTMGAAGETWQLPVIGSEWVGSPFFPETDPTWQLSYSVIRGDNADPGPTDWSPARWFAEGRGFTANLAYVLAKPAVGAGSTLSAVPNGSRGGMLTPQVAWDAPRNGTYVCSVRVGNVSGNIQGAGAAAGLRVYRMPKGKDSAEFLGEGLVAAGHRIEVVLSADLESGDRLAFRPASRSFEYCFLENLEIIIGRFDKMHGKR